jgi:hypothetical protein
VSGQRARGASAAARPTSPYNAKPETKAQMKTQRSTPEAKAKKKAHNAKRVR